MKTKLQILAAVLIIGAWFMIDARSDYTWSDIVIQQKTAEGWTLIIKDDSFADAIRPWTWLNTPVTRLWFTKPSQSRHFGPIVVAPVLSVSYDYSRTEQAEHVELFNVTTGKSAFLPQNITPDKINYEGLEWRDYPTGTPGDKIIIFFRQMKGIK